MKNLDSKTENQNQELREIDTQELAKATGGYRTDGVDSADYQSWYFTQGPGKAN
jgi:hypothetical protein